MGLIYSSMLTAKRLKITPSQYIKLRHLMLVCEIDARVVFSIVGEFKGIDIDGSGQISAMELFNHYAVTDSEFNRRAMAIMDDQETTRMSLDVLEYIAAVYNYCTYDRESLMLFIFKIFDADGSGYLELAESVPGSTPGLALSSTSRCERAHVRQRRRLPLGTSTGRDDRAIPKEDRRGAARRASREQAPLEASTHG